MRQFYPRETIVEGFLRVASRSNSKIKQYLLKRAGLSSHDLHLFVDGNSPISLSSPSVGDPYFYERFLFRIASNNKIRILNATSTEPVICEQHFFLEVPDNVPLQIALSEETDSGWKEIKTKYSSQAIFYLNENPTDGVLFELPVLKKGMVLVTKERKFNFSLHLNLDDKIINRLRNEQEFKPSEDILNHGSIAYRNFVEKCELWCGIILDNEELLPYKWDYAESRFVAGFFSDGSVVTK